MTTDIETRAAYTAGLRQLADALDAHPGLPLPTGGSVAPLTIHFLHGDDPRAAMAAAARVLPVTWAKDAWEGASGGAYFELAGALAGLAIRLSAYRDAVCTRIVTGTREVTETVADPAALAAVPRVEVTRTEDIVEWECSSLLAPERSA